MMFNSTVNNHNKVKWRNNLNDLSDLEDDLDNELPLSSISDFGHPFDNHEINKSNAQKCKTIDCQEKWKIKQDNKSSHIIIAYIKRPNVNYEIKKHRPQKYETVDYQIELDIKQDNELPLSSIADFLCPVNHEIGNGELKKCEAVYFQSKENINNYNKSESDRIICNKELNTINNLSERYECDICGKIFPKRIHIINHFKISLCYPDIIYFYDKLFVNKILT